MINIQCDFIIDRKCRTCWRQADKFYVKLDFLRISNLDAHFARCNDHCTFLKSDIKFMTKEEFIIETVHD